MEAIIGYVAAFGTAIALYPQVVKVMRTRQTGDISRRMYLIYTGSGALWLVYGLMRSDWPLIASSTATTLASAIILIYKLRER